MFQMWKRGAKLVMYWNQSMFSTPNSRKPRGGFSLVELLVVIAIVIILLALLVPTIGNVMADRRQTECANHLKQNGIAIETARSSGGLIKASNWTSEISEFLDGDGTSLFCPDDSELNQRSSYGMNNRAHRFGDLDGTRIVMIDYRKPEATLVVDSLISQDDWSDADGLYAARHLRGLNALLHTGGVKSYEASAIDPRVCELWERYWRPHADKQLELEGCNSAATTTNTSPPADEGPPPDRDPHYDDSDLDKCTQQVLIIDDGDSGFSTTYDDSYKHTTLAQWLIDMYIGAGLEGQIPWEHVDFRPLTFLPPDSIGIPYGANHLYAEGHQASGLTEAVYEFQVDPGKYRVWAHWMGAPSHSSSTPIVIQDGGSTVGQTTVNQKLNAEGAAVEQGEQAVADPDSPGVLWYPLGEYDIDSETLTVRISAAAGAVGLAEGANHVVVADAIRIECSDAREFYPDRCYDEKPDAVDETAATQVGDWQIDDVEGAYQGSQAFTVAGSGDNTVTFNFDNVTPGLYQVYTCFVPRNGQATNAPFTLYDGMIQHGTVNVDQSSDYSGPDIDDDGKKWYKIGSYEIKNQNGVHLVVSDNADGNVVADAARIVCSFQSYGDDSSNCDYRNEIYGRECRKYYSEDYGADEETEHAVSSALNWLSRHQYEGGYWSFDHQNATCPYISAPEPCESQCGSPGSSGEYRVAATGMALLPFLGAGFGPTHEKYGEVVTQGLKYLMTEIDARGAIHSSAGNSGGHGYEVGIATWALVEGLGVCRISGFGELNEQELTRKAVAATNFLTGTQNGSGGWRYLQTGDHDMTVTGWVVNALAAASSVGINYQAPGDRDTMANVRGMLDELSHTWTIEPGGVATEYYYGWTWGMLPAKLYDAHGAGTHIGRLLRLLTGSTPSTPGMPQSAQQELARISKGMPDESYKNFYAHHFMRRMGSDYWPKWDDAMKRYLLEDNPQPTTGHARGSWEIGGSTLTSPACGKLWDTVSGSLCLEVYYRYAEGI